MSLGRGVGSTGRWMCDRVYDWVLLGSLVPYMFDSWCLAFPVQQVSLVFVLLCPEADKMAIKNYIAL